MALLFSVLLYICTSLIHFSCHCAVGTSQRCLSGTIDITQLIAISKAPQGDLLEFFQNIDRCIDHQQKLFTWSKKLLGAHRTLHSLSENHDRLIDTLLLQQKKDGTSDSYFHFVTDEGRAFVLHYKSALQDAKYEKFAYIIRQWRSTQNPEVKSMIKLLDMKLQGKEAREKKDLAIKKITHFFEVIDKVISRDQYVTNVYKNKKSPLVFSKQLESSFHKWIKSSVIKIACNAFTERYQEHDVQLEKEQIEHHTDYKKNKTSIRELQKDIANKISEIKEKNAQTFLPAESTTVNRGKTRQKDRRKKTKSRSNRRRHKPIGTSNSSPNLLTTRTQATSSKDAGDNAGQIQPQAKKTSLKQKKPLCPTDKDTSTKKKTFKKSPRIQGVKSSPEIIASSSTLHQESTVYTDGSYIIKNSDIIITMYDAQNDMVIKLFTTESPQKEYSHKNLNYSKTIQNWLAHPLIEMERQGYNDPHHKNFQLRKTAQRVHSFTPLADRFLIKCARKIIAPDTKHTGKMHTWLIMPGAIVQDGKEHLGLFIYIIDNTQKEPPCFHRNFKKQTWKELVQDDFLREGLYNYAYDQEFPKLDSP